ncbi:hypothetical protein FRZ67_04450 [Panacibacter ginsenosidivorans]|uniref:Uncharacterized protein n=1 Tax=Panacibacter ginsenosidivorans TaxID=1813871 RepID=A0A5B8V5T6_9BACT|nr:hypothetical protein [Panacibacter ginsenosidivorans]QEC66582.1 hypothetical protein FRZ67_04450 [Panacibacter ginsenosidivorans]
MTTLGNISLQDARDLAKRYRDAHSTPPHTPFYFLSKKFLDIISGVPGVDGLKLYQGLTADQKEVLLMVPAHINDPGSSKENWVDIVEYSYTINEDKKTAYSQDFNNTIFLLSGPCPPPPSGYTSGKLD